MTRLTDQVHNLILEKVRSSQLIVDATVGNGHDLLFVLKNCQADAEVFGFDIQAKAITNTQEKLNLENLQEHAQLINDCHSKIESHITSPIDLAIFNLGYLPGGDKNITTKSATSLACLKSCLKLLSPTGAISLMLYPGHPAGAEETQVIQDYLETINDKYSVFITKATNPPQKSLKKAPLHYFIRPLSQL